MVLAVSAREVIMTFYERTKKTLKNQDLSEIQNLAAAERGRNVVLTAGAGSGKTRTLVARYLSLLTDGYQPERVVAITFTEKAANEMRSRVRSAIRKQITSLEDQDNQHFWIDLERHIDAARIGTIHSLCAEILRTHPAQAGIDPLFDVVDEGQAAVFISDAVEIVLTQISMDEKYLPLFELLRVKSLEEILTQMIRKRLDLEVWLKSHQSQDQILQSAIQSFLQLDEIQKTVNELRSFSRHQIEGDTTDKGVQQVFCFLEAWEQVDQAFWLQNFQECLTALVRIRKQVLIRMVGSSTSVCKALLSEWRGTFDQQMGWLGDGIDQILEEKIWLAISLVKDACALTIDQYNTFLSNLRALDFDDLESRALQLLQQPEIARKWQEKVQALLVDEFQDTNQRQRQIVDALTAGKPGVLFVVGDARQSIYRFRGADVSVFRDVQSEANRSGGLVEELDVSHRTHECLLHAMEDILAAIMGTLEDSKKPFQVPFTRMEPHRKEAPVEILQPYLELLIGAGEDSEQGRILAANLLADRLLEYKRAGDIQNWKDVALLFRASGAFPIYEQALEAAGIPYVTIAGSGFYDRPEIRDVLNLLRALADPWDDLAMVGLLRSPAIGMSDLGITRMRWSQSKKNPIGFHQAINKDINYLSAPDVQAVQRARRLFSQIEPLVGKIQVAFVLQRLIEQTNYRVILAGSPERSWRNIEKLLLDAYDSGQTSIHAYLEMVQKVRAIGVREGEAAGVAEDALQLLTIHKSKGLEFPWVILADAGRRSNVKSDRWLLIDQTLSITPDKIDYKPWLVRYLKSLDDEREEAENKRLLYVAMTRAKDKLIISGHLSKYRDKYVSNGWLKKLLDLFDLDTEVLVMNPPIEPISLVSREPIGIHVCTEVILFPPLEKVTAIEQLISINEMVQPRLVEQETFKESTKEEKSIDLFESSANIPLWVGKILHHAIHRWRFPDENADVQFLYRAAVSIGILDREIREKVVQDARTYLQRLWEHPIYGEINQASQRYHEVPYEIQEESGRLDVLYRDQSGWRIVDFKTDRISDLNDLSEERKSQYRSQLLRYQKAVNQQIKEKPLAQLCFLNCGSTVKLVNLDEF
jgi:ATP-dependent exoDNAse (exonuclease V) beta subunit